MGGGWIVETGQALGTLHDDDLFAGCWGIGGLSPARPLLRSRSKHLAFRIKILFLLTLLIRTVIICINKTTTTWSAADARPTQTR